MAGWGKALFRSDNELFYPVLGFGIFFTRGQKCTKDAEQGTEPRS